MLLAFSVNGVPIRIPEERLKHIYKNHPELKDSQDRILEVINNPGLVQKGDAGTLLAIKKFAVTPVTTNKYLIVVYSELNDFDGFVLTAYYTNNPRRRLVIWKN